MRRVVMLCLALVGTAQAAPKPKVDAAKQQCIDDAEEGQALRDGGKLRDARERFVRCASVTCPGAVVKECREWLADVETRMPTVVVGAVDGSGRDLVDVTVSLDGKPLLDRLTGTQTPMDPGPHRMRFEMAGTPAVEETFVIAEREKGRVLRAKFGRTETAGPVAPIEPAPHASAPVAAYIVGGAGVVALASFAFFGLRGYSDYNDLKDTCDPHCSKSASDDVKTKFLIADVSLGVGVVALGVATYLFLSHPKAESRSENAKRSPWNHAVLTPVRGGGWLAGYETRF